MTDPIGDRATRALNDLIRFSDTAAHPEVAWRSMKATRNVVAHRYDQVDYDIIWNALLDRLPAEAIRVRRILAGLS